MRKYLYLVSGLAFALAVAAVGSAFGTGTGEVQTIRGKVCAYSGQNRCSEPRPLPNSGGGAPVQLKIYTDGDTTPPGNEPHHVTKAIVKLDNSFTIDTTGLARVRASDLTGKTTADVRSDPVLAKARIGTGLTRPGFTCSPPTTDCGAIVRIGDGGGATEIGADVTAFNGRPQNGHPVILMHVSNDSLGGACCPNPNPLVGVVTTNNTDLGKVLTINPVGQPSAGTLVHFGVALKRHWTYQGHPHDYLHAKCNDANQKLNFKAAMTFDTVGVRSGIDFARCS